MQSAGEEDAAGFTGHSFHRGGASWAFQSGIPGELIQVCGDWVSDAYKRYLERLLKSLLEVCVTFSISSNTFVWPCLVVVYDYSFLLLP